MARAAAIDALGKVGGEQALEALSQRKKKGDLMDIAIDRAMEEIRSRAARLGTKRRQTGGGTVEWDEDADSQQRTAKLFPRVRAADPEEATAIAFDKALKMAQRLATDEVYRPFNEVAYPWGAKRLHRGPVSAIRALVLDNLTRISREAESGSFDVHLRSEATVRISALFPEFFIGVQVWQSQEDCPANGNSDFRPSSALSPSSGIKVETAE